MVTKALFNKVAQKLTEGLQRSFNALILKLTAPEKFSFEDLASRSPDTLDTLETQNLSSIQKEDLTFLKELHALTRAVCATYGEVDFPSPEITASCSTFRQNLVERIGEANRIYDQECSRYGHTDGASFDSSSGYSYFEGHPTEPAKYLFPHRYESSRPLSDSYSYGACLDVSRAYTKLNFFEKTIKRVFAEGAQITRDKVGAIHQTELIDSAPHLT